MKKRLQIIGSHPAGMWLALYLSHRAWPLELIVDKECFQPSWGSFYSGFYPIFGETEPRWPLEWCKQELYGLVEVYAFELQRLRNLSIQLLDFDAMRRELCAEWLRTSSCAKNEELVSDPLFRIEIKWAEPQPLSERNQGWEQVGQLKNAVLPTGLLTIWKSEKGGQLALAPLNPGVAAYTYQCSDRSLAETEFRALLSEALPSYEIAKFKLSLRSILRQWPDIHANKSNLLIIIPRPALRAENMLMQGVSWLLIQSLACWLTEGLTRFEDLGSRLENYLQKIQSGLLSMRQSDKYLRIMD